MSVVAWTEVEYRVTINNAGARIVERCTENDDGWREQFYSLDTPAKVYEHLVYNLGLHDRRLSQLEGWGDCADDDVTVEELRGSFEVTQLLGLGA